MFNAAGIAGIGEHEGGVVLSRDNSLVAAKLTGLESTARVVADPGDNNNTEYDIALMEVGRVLKQKMARQKRKPKRFTKDGTSQTMAPCMG